MPPGGLAGETDLQAAVRETREEVGLDIGDSNRWRLLGRIPDRVVSRDRGSLAVACLVFEQIAGADVPPVEPSQIQASEVGDRGVFSSSRPARSSCLHFTCLDPKPLGVALLMSPPGLVVGTLLLTLPQLAMPTSPHSGRHRWPGAGGLRWRR